MGRPTRIPIPHTTRYFYPFRGRVFLIALLLIFFQQQRLYYVYRNSLSAKYSPTNFNLSVTELRPRLSRPDDEDAQFQDGLLANRDAWQLLGAGWEGSAYVYNDSVIKTFTPGRSPFRNCVPGITTEKWPTEIPASILFGGSQHVTTDTASNDSTTSFSGFLPVKAYFIASSTPESSSGVHEWHLVTPLLRGGSLTKLSKKLSTRPKTMGYRELDALYRPTFNRLLHDLGTLHEAGYCHDDIKPANIFVDNDTHWILGDLGNVRHVSHPFHSSRIWRDNEQLEDCRANDALRLLKSYTSFVRQSSNDANIFNAELYEGTAPLSRLFWRIMSKPSRITAGQVRVQSIIEYPLQPPNPYPSKDVPLPGRQHTPMSMFSSRETALHSAVTNLLRTRMSESKARWLGMTWLFGLPVDSSCTV